MTTKLFKTDVRGVGPYCVEFEDGEIVATRTEKRQRLIAAAPDLLAAAEAALPFVSYVANNGNANAHEVAAKLEAAIAAAKEK